MRTDPAAASAALHQAMNALDDFEAEVIPFGEFDRDPPESLTATPMLGNEIFRNHDSLPFVWARDVADVDAYCAEILEDVLTTGSMSVWYGESNSGKTYLLLSLGFSIARTTNWLGKRTTGGAVIYVAAEGSKTIEQRVRADRLANGSTDFPFGIVKASVDMCRSGLDTERLADLVVAKSAEIGCRPVLVIIDTLSRVIAGGNENDSADMGALVRNSDRLRELTGAHIAWVHHSGKDVARGARGHSLLRAAVDTEIEVTHDVATGIRYAKVTKQRDLGSHGLELCAKLRPIELGLNQWGRPVTACVVDPVESDGRVMKRAAKALRSHNLRAFNAAVEIARDGEIAPGTSIIPAGKRLIPLEQWRERFRDTCGDMQASSFRSAWARVQRELQDAGRIGIHREFAWIW